MHSIRTLTSPITRLGLARAVHSSPRTLAAAAPTKGQAPEASRQPRERTHLEQNPHLKHAASSGGGETGRDRGKGNAAPDPELPSKKLEGNSRGKRGGAGLGNLKRGLHTTAVWRAAGGDGDGASKHSADSYFKDVDASAPASAKTHAVDGASGAAHRPNEQYADPQKEYATVSHEEPYEPPAEEGARKGGEKGGQKEQDLGYGGTGKDAEKGRSSSGEGPAGSNAGGRKPEGKR